MSGKIDVPALGEERFEIGDGGLGAGQEDYIGISRKRLPALNQVHAHAGFEAKRIEIVEIRNEGQEGNGNSKLPPLTLSLSRPARLGELAS
jgi:hypothetical protein